MREKTYLYTLNGGEVSPLAMGRVDLSRMRISGETYLNVIPRVIGALQVRPGLKSVAATRGGNAQSRMIPFIFSATDTAFLEMANLEVLFWQNEVALSNNSNGTDITNGDFSSATGWTLTTTGTGVADINSTVSGALVLQTPGRGDTASCLRSFTVSGAQDEIEHSLEVIVTQGPVRVRIGTTSGGQETLPETKLATGTHHLRFTPGNGNNTLYIRLSAESEYRVVVDSCEIDTSAGSVALTTVWPTAILPSLRFDQSGDVIYVASSDGMYQPHKIIRNTTNSWSVVPYHFTNGPFREKTADITLTPSVRLGNGTLTASADFFDSNHVGACFAIAHESTTTSVGLSGSNRFTDTVEVSGNSYYDTDQDGTNEATDERNVTITITGTFVATVTVQISYDDGVTWSPFETYTTTTGATTIRPGYPNSVCLVRAGILPGDYTSGTSVVTLSYDGGGGYGAVLITAVASGTSASYIVTKRLHGTAETPEWREGRWSSFRGWPTAVGLFEGRLWWGGQDRIAGSVSDDFENFDDEITTDDGPIDRSVATGPVNAIRWILGLSRLCIGTSGAEPVGRSSSFDEPITNSNFSIKDASTQGSADIQAVKIDKLAVYVQRSGKRAHQLNYSLDNQDYGSRELSKFHPTVLDAGVAVIAVQRQPDTRIWFVMDDGTAVCLVYDPTEDVLSWFNVVTDGTIVDVTVLPGTEDDNVYFIVERFINGGDKYYIEKLSYDHEAQGGTTNYMADGWESKTLSSDTSFTGLNHLEGKTNVVVWVNGAPIMDGDSPKLFTVGSNEISDLGGTYSGTAIAGLQYEWKWKSAKLAYGVHDGNPIGRRKKVTQLSPVLYKTHIRAFQYGYDFSNMSYLPFVSNIDGETEDTSKVYDDYTPDHLAAPTQWNTDARLCLKGLSPLPCTILGLSMTVDAN